MIEIRHCKCRIEAKLVTPCSGDEYVINEYLVYKLYNLVTPKSLWARLVKVVFCFAVNDMNSYPNFGVPLEEEEQMAEINGTFNMDTKLIDPRSKIKEGCLKMEVSKYLIRNTDW